MNSIPQSAVPWHSNRHKSVRRAGKLSKLGGCVATTVGAGILATPATDAAVIAIDIGPSGFNIAGINAGLPAGGNRTVNDFPFTGAGYLILANGFSPSFWGLVSYGGIANSGSLASPVNIPFGGTIDSSLSFVGFYYGLFRADTYVSPDFGSGSYIGFQTAAPDPHYGYLEVTWDNTLNQFEILSGAYESDPNTPILAGAPPSPTPIPEIDPSGFASVMSMAIGSLAMLEQRRRKRAAAAAMTATIA